MKRIVLALCASGLALAASMAGAGEEAIELRDAPGRDLTLARCVICHSVDYIEANAPVMDRALWHKTIRKMIDRYGAPITDEDAATILDYLAAQYSKVDSTLAE
jgi:mono/diheme cytochrome c family protein